ncbi:MAG TPA: EF-P lysine aminoacylase EpmA [Thermodesulfobacteriota bacterium]|nr:EF-P lysine aminoacylase EpmA [Thermodesulfobacteriota bacterium]
MGGSNPWREHGYDNHLILAGRKKALEQRARLLREIRQFFVEKGYLEVETPHRIPTPAPESHIDAVPSLTWFLHTSPELCMKRMMAAGYEKIFQICRCWRERERGSLHLPEFTLLEWYRAGCDYRSLMEECEEMIRFVAQRIGVGRIIHFRDRQIDLSFPWDRISVVQAFQRYSRATVGEALKKNLFDEIMVQEIEPNLGLRKPAFLYDYPAERGALARLKDGDPTVAERFELYMGGVELANGFSELVDSEEQRKRFIIENENRQTRGKPVYSMPDRFLAELDAMPPSGGIALGVDRLVLVFSDAKIIDEVVAFTPEEL